MNEYLPDLTTRTLLLRQPRQEDDQEISRLAGDPEISANTLEIPYSYDEKMPRDWIRVTERKRDERSEQVFLITNRTSGEIIGAIGLMGLIPEHSREKIGTGLEDRSGTRDMPPKRSVQCWITGSDC